MERIIVGYDGSEQAERALERAAELAQALAARLVVVSVVQAPTALEPVPAVETAEALPVALPGAVATPAPLPVPTEPQPEPKELAQGDLERARRALAKKRIEAEYLADVGDAAERLLALARERDVDLIVVGSREHGFLERLLRRPVNEAVASGAGCDVLIVR